MKLAGAYLMVIPRARAPALLRGPPTIASDASNTDRGFASNVDIEFLGGASQVGRLGMLFRVGGTQLLFDYGMLPARPPEYPLEAPPVDAAFLSHAHLDHSGMIPWLT